MGDALKISYQNLPNTPGATLHLAITTQDLEARIRGILAKLPPSPPPQRAPPRGPRRGPPRDVRPAREPP